TREVQAPSVSGTPQWTLHSGSSGPFRFDASAIYDPVGDRMIVYGGTQLGVSVHSSPSTYAFELSGAPQWVLLAPGGDFPYARSEHLALFDALRRNMLVYGGYEEGGYSNNVHYFEDFWD